MNRKNKEPALTEIKKLLPPEEYLEDIHKEDYLRYIATKPLLQEYYNKTLEAITYILANEGFGFYPREDEDGFLMIFMNNHVTISGHDVYGMFYVTIMHITEKLGPNQLNLQTVATFMSAGLIDYFKGEL